MIIFLRYIWGLAPPPPPYQKAGYATVAFAHQKSGQMKMADSAPPPPPHSLLEIAATESIYVTDSAQIYAVDSWIVFSSVGCRLAAKSALFIS